MRSSAARSPAASSATGKLQSTTQAEAPMKSRIAWNSAVDSTGLSSCSRSHWLASSSSTLPRLPSRVFSDITRVSRRLSIGGLVTWLNVLPEVMMQSAVALRQHGERRVVAHRADRLLRVFHHRVQQHFLLFHGEANGDLAAAQQLGVVDDRFDRVGLDDVVDHLDALGPFAERLARGEQVLQRLVAIEPCRRPDRCRWSGRDRRGPSR